MKLQKLKKNGLLLFNTPKNTLAFCFEDHIAV